MPHPPPPQAISEGRQLMHYGGMALSLVGILVFLSAMLGDFSPARHGLGLARHPPWSRAAASAPRSG